MVKYGLVFAGTILAYVYMHSFLTDQFGIYTLHVGAPATMLVIFAGAGWYVDRFSKKRWGKMGVKGYAILTLVLVGLTALLQFGFGYKFFGF